MYVCHADDIMTHVLGMWMFLTQAGQQGYAPGHYPGSLRWSNYLPQMVLGLYRVFRED